MADSMVFPDTPEEFIEEYKFKDEENAYTNESDLISVSKVKQMLNHYNQEEMNRIINNYASKISIEENSVLVLSIPSNVYPTDFIKRVVESIHSSLGIQVIVLFNNISISTMQIDKLIEYLNSLKSNNELKS